MTSLLVSSRNVGNLKLYWFQVRREFQWKTTQNPKFALSSSPRIQKIKDNIHLMYGPEGNSKFCFPESPDVSLDFVSGNIRT